MELVVVGFDRKYRASEVLTELRLRGMLLFDLDHAITISLEEPGHIVVQQSIDLAGEGESRWAALWGGFLETTVFQPFVERLSEAASKVARRESSRAREKSKSQLGREWWLFELGISDDFVRDVGALIQPGGSAIMAPANNFKAAKAVSRLSDWGGSLIYASLNQAQTEKLQGALRGD